MLLHMALLLFGAFGSLKVRQWNGGLWSFRDSAWDFPRTRRGADCAAGLRQLRVLAGSVEGFDLN